MVRYEGRKSGRLTVLKKEGTANHKILICKCECGNIAKVSYQHFMTGHTKSCGCLRTEMVSAGTHTTHGECYSRLNSIWRSMRTRCRNVLKEYNKYWAGRGIKVCDEWEDYSVFAAWAKSNGYQEGLSIDRIDVNGDYCPENCRWVTNAEQQRNKQNTIYYTLNGITKPLIEWCEDYGVKFNTVRKRMTKGYSGEKLFTKPPIDGRRTDGYSWAN